MSMRLPALSLAAGRCVAGTSLLVAPRRAGRFWAGPAAARSGPAVLARALGARDLLLGIGTLAAVRSGSPSAAMWLAAGAFADAVDAAATLTSFRHLGRPGRVVVLGVATGAAGLGAACALDARTWTTPAE